MIRAACALACLLGVCTAAVAADDMPAPASCEAPSEIVRLGGPLPRTHATLSRADPLRIVALGSSSTAGAGASASRFTYPSRLAVELARRYPLATIEIVNRGVNGEDVWENVKRLDDDVLDAKPDLVIWQIGTNAVLHDIDYDDFDRTAQGGIDRLKAAGIDVLLMDLQYAPRVTEVPDHRRMLEHLASIGERNGLPVFHRYALMAYWSERMQARYASMLSSDGLHLNDTSYGCLAERLADAISGDDADDVPRTRIGAAALE